jgi:LysM repeat protein
MIPIKELLRLKILLFRMKVVCRIKMLVMIMVVVTINYDITYSQVIVEKSKDKVIISGVTYYVHQVKKGETAYSISKAYGISVEELTTENPTAVHGVNEGQSLRIPFRQDSLENTASPVSTQRQNRDESRFIYHSLLPGETVYSLSKYYGVSENEIIKSNPGIDINKLSVDTEIAVPRKVLMSKRRQPDEQEKKYFFHQVIKGESLSSIAEKYGLTLRELRKENRDLRFPQVGDYVRIPDTNAPEPLPVEPVIADTVRVVEKPVVKIERPAGFTKIYSLKGTLNVAVLLPFYLGDNSERSESDSSGYIKDKFQNRPVRKPEEWIYPRSLDFVEMYNGILLAADTLRSLGLNININAFDIKSDTVDLVKLIRSGKLNGMDLIIGPVYSHNLSIVADYANNLGIPVVSPVTLMNNSVLAGHPTLFMANSSLEIAQKALAKRISNEYDNNLIFIHADTSGTDEDVKEFRKLILTEMSHKMPYEDIKFKEIPFYSRSAFDNDSVNRLGRALSERSKNIVVIASEEAPVISETITDIHTLSKRFNIKVFGYPSMLDIENLDPKVFFDLDQLIFSPYWIDYANKDVMCFNSSYFKKFLTEPIDRSFAWMGYDISFYFLSGLALNGKDFIRHPEIHNPALLQTKFNFVRKEPDGGYENQNLFLIRYTKDYEVKLVERNDIVGQK